LKRFFFEIAMFSDDDVLQYLRAKKVAPLMDQLVGELLAAKPVEPHAFLKSRLVDMQALAAPRTLVLLRHGESEWNSSNRFTGWVDVDLTTTGRAEADKAGRALRDAGHAFDIAYTSVLKRAIHTLCRVLDAVDQPWIPTVRSWRLNERHLGALTGLDKKQTADQYGAEQVQQWRRGFDDVPPPLAEESLYHSSHDRKYRALGAIIPDTESLKNTLDRALALWDAEIAPALRAGRRVLIVAHGNTVRALCKHLDAISDEAIVDLDIPTGIPMVYTLDANLKPVAAPHSPDPLSATFLGDPEAVRLAQQQIRRQTDG